MNESNPRVRETYPDFTTLLRGVTAGKTLLKLGKGDKVFSQGERADAIYFIQSGKVKITSLSTDGREAVFAVLGAPAFFGEASLTGQMNWQSSATTVEASSIFRIEKHMMLAILRKPELCTTFRDALLNRIIRLEEDIRAQFFYDNTKKLQRALLKLALLDQHSGLAEVRLPRWSHETLGRMVNASRSHVTRLMNKFRKSGLIDYNRVLTVKTKRISNALMRA